MKYTIKTFMMLLVAGINAQNLTGTWTGLLDAKTIEFTIVFHLEKDSLGKDICLMDSPDQSVKGILSNILHLSSDSVSIDIPLIGARYSGKLSGIPLKAFSLKWE